MRLIHFAIALCVLSVSFQNGSSNILTGLIDSTLGAVGSILDLISTPNESVLNLGKNGLLALPLELALKAYNEYCKYTFFLQITQILSTFYLLSFRTICSSNILSAFVI